MAEEKIFPEGIRVFAPHSNAPDFVKGTVIITMRELVDFVTKNQNYLQDYEGKKQLKLQLLQGRDGGMYMQVDTWKKGDAPSTQKQAPKPTESGTWTAAKGDDPNLPF